MQTNLLRRILHLLLPVVLLLSCQIAPDHRSTPSNTPLTLIFSPWIGYFPAIIAQEKGFFQQQGVAVKLLLDSHGSLQLANFAANKFDALAVPIGDSVRVASVNPDLRLVLLVDVSEGADVVMADTSVKSVADLRGKSLGTRLGAFGEVFVNEMLTQNDLTSADMTVINVDGEQLPSYLKGNRVVAGHTWEPHVTQLEKAGYRRLFTSRNTPGLISDGIMFRGSTLRDRPEDVRAFIRAWFQAVDFWLANPKEGNALISRYAKIPEADLSLEGVKLSRLEDNRKAFQSDNTTQSLEHTTGIFTQFYVRKGMLTRRIAPAKLLDASFLPN